MFTFAIMIAASASADAQVTKGQKSLGVKGGYVTRNNAPSAGLQFEYTFSKRFILAPSVDYVFRHEGCDGLLFNIDYHGPWNLTTDGRWYVYHVIGVNYASWNRHLPKGMENMSRAGEMDSDTDDDVTMRKNRFGLDVGAGLAWYAKPTLKVSLEGKFNWVKNYNTGIFTLGISYVF